MTLALGSSAPDFALRGVDGHERALADYAAFPVLALVQSCNHCPYVIAWEDRLIEVQREYGPRGVQIVAVNSNDADRYPADSFDEMRARAEARAFTFDYLYDEEQSLARALEAERTPEVFLFDAERRLAYHGAIDDSRDEHAVSEHYLRDALDAVLAGREPPVPDTRPVGCSVKWKPCESATPTQGS